MPTNGEGAWPEAEGDCFPHLLCFTSKSCFWVCLSGSFQKAGRLTSVICVLPPLLVADCNLCHSLLMHVIKRLQNHLASAGSHQAQAHPASDAAACPSSLHNIQHLHLMATGRHHLQSDQNPGSFMLY